MLRNFLVTSTMKDFHYLLLRETYFALSIFLGVFIILEIIKPGLVLGYLNLNFLLFFWAINAIILLYYKKN